MRLRWKRLKYEIRKFAISYCKQRTKKDVGKRKYLENKLKNLVNVLDDHGNLESYHNIKDKIEEIYGKNGRRHKNKKQMLVVRRR